ncbi:hypothetical protein A4V04_02015 [Burkholderiales bacterium YL45]|uniref:DUF3732 domain-containing protein n=1 Tax=Turicimonas muris TaxID=1796652 RepID=A0A227KST6_9BURK|nr:DUF3732 domain-containing protein [Turicimonas muris]ANU65330.1 hypothetical protein A4V04_02015 [Burkholderiales bacterium YL45]OXE51135.1 hypothetical protein ADH67_02255 [Turicimonas muris]QQQ96484.1 DUF3732 domain-containing protein [Turicimonas muris]
MGRYPDQSKAFLQRTDKETDDLRVEDFPLELFTPLKVFKQNLAKNFGLKVKDVEENLEALNFRKRKNPPSVRLFLPYMIQNQTLVASKDSLFYGFQDSIKKDLTIEQFSIVSGFVDQEYFYKLQEINKLKKEQKLLIGKKKYLEERAVAKRSLLESLSRQYELLTGQTVELNNSTEFLSTAEEIVSRKEPLLTSIEDEAQRSIKELNDIDRKINLENAEIRDRQQKINDIEKTKLIPKKIEENFAPAKVSGQDYPVYKSKCPFCSNVTDGVLRQANKLAEAIAYLNQELSSIPALEDSFDKELHELKEELIEHRKKLKILQSEKQKILAVSDNLRKNYSLNDQAYRLLFKLQIVSEELENNGEDFKKSLKELTNQIKKLEEELISNYPLEKEMEKASEYISDQINEIANKLDFEESYKPLNFKFDLKKFELLTKVQDERVQVRQMGSGANWLYCHLSLFMAFTRFFSYHIKSALIPPILFLDQPSQVYFPSSDEKSNFEGIQEEENPNTKVQDSEVKENRRKDDLEEVKNFFNQIVIFNKNTLKFTGYEPQIIITEHADHLELNACNFESLVRARWREPGLGLVDLRANEDVVLNPTGDGNVESKNIPENPSEK